MGKCAGGVALTPARELAEISRSRHPVVYAPGKAIVCGSEATVRRSMDQMGVECKDWSGAVGQRLQMAGGVKGKGGKIYGANWVRGKFGWRRE